ncbi:MAG: cytochrome c oxidase subunit 3 [Bacteroidia bacterium]
MANQVKVHPKEFMLWAYLASMALLFGGFTSAYIVARVQPSWKPIEIPEIFWVTTIVILLSSISLEWTKKQAQARHYAKLRWGLGTTFFMGILFLIGQLIGWRLLVQQGVYLSSNNQNASFFYVLTWLHAMHLLVGLIVIGRFLYKVGSYKFDLDTDYLGMRLGILFWHALGVLWLYLFVFLQANQHIRL